MPTNFPIPLPPSNTDPSTPAGRLLWQNYYLALQNYTASINPAPINAKYLVATADATLTDEVNLGVLPSGYVSITTALGLATVSSSPTIPISVLTGTLPIVNGGTNSSTALSGSSVMVSNGTAIVQGPAGTSTTVLHGNASGLPTYGAVSLTADVSGTLPAVNGGTGQSSYTTGDLLAANSGTTLTTVADVATGNALLSGGVGAVPSYGKVGLTTHVSGTLPIANGGTNSSTALSGSSIMVSNGSAVVQGAAGTSTTVLHGNASGAPTYAAVSLSADVTGTLPATNGGTGQSSYAVGDLVYASTTTALSSLADVATGNALLSGGVGVAPSYGKVGLTTHVSGTLPVANGGTNSNTALSGSSIMVSNGTAVVQGAAGTSTTVLHGNASGTPTYSAVSLTADVSGTLPATNGGTGVASYAVGDLLTASSTTALTTLADVATGNALLSGGVGVAPSYGKVGLTTHVSGTLPIANGGTNSSTALSGSTIMVSNGTAVVQGSAGTSTTVLHGNASGLPTYSAVSLVNDITGTLAAGNGGTGQSSYAVGDLLYASTTSALSKLADVATGNALISGGVGVAPSYGKIGLTTHVSGTLPVGNGGTGLATLTANYIPYGNGTSAFQSASNFTFDGTTLTTPGQIAFPAVQNASTNANTLDDYEEGTFTPVIGGSGGTSGQTYLNQGGYYIKIGQLVWILAYCVLSAKGTITTNVEIQGLPFTSNTATLNYQSVSVAYSSLATNWVNIMGVIVPNSTVMSIVGATGAAPNNQVALTTADIGNTTRLFVTATYRATA